MSDFTISEENKEITKQAFLDMFNQGAAVGSLLVLDPPPDLNDWTEQQIDEYFKERFNEIWVLNTKGTPYEETE